MQCGDSSSPYSSGSKVSPIVILPAGVSPPPSSAGGEGISGFLWWPIAVASAGAAMLACCAFLAIAAYRRRKRTKKDPPDDESSDDFDRGIPPVGNSDTLQDQIKESSAHQSKLSQQSESTSQNKRTAGWVKADNYDPEAGVTVVPTGLVSSNSIMRSLQSQADAVAASTVKEVLKDVPSKENNKMVSDGVSNGVRMLKI